MVVSAIKQRTFPMQATQCQWLRLALQGVRMGCSPELVLSGHPDSSRCSAPRVGPRSQEAVRPASETGSWHKAPGSTSEG